MAKSKTLWTAVVAAPAPAGKVEENVAKEKSSKGRETEHLLEKVAETQDRLEAVHKKAMEEVIEREQALKAENLSLGVRLNEALKKLMILQPRQETSDETIKQAYEDFCQNLEDFADSEFGSMVNLGERIARVDWTFPEAAIVFSHFTEDDVRLCNMYPEISSNILMNMVFSYLFDNWLDEEKWCCFGPRSEEVLLDTIAESVAQQNPASGSILSNRWRAETYLALSNLPERSMKQQEAMRKTNASLCRVLSKLMVRQLDYGTFREKIINKAFRLSNLMRGSVTKYSFGFPPASVTSDMTLKTGQAESYRLLDAQTGLEIDKDGSKTRDEIMGKLRLCVFPGLNKVKDDGSLLPMVKAVVVAELAMSSEVEKKLHEREVDPLESIEKKE